jgi:hypothetical protein
MPSSIWRYTAQDGGGLLRKGASDNLKTMIDEAQAAGSVWLFSVRHEFPMEWAKFMSVKFDKTTITAGLSLTLLPQHYPFWAQGIVGSEKAEVNTVELFAKMLPTNKNLDVNLYDIADPKAALNQNPSLGNLLTGNMVNIGKLGVITDATHPPLTLYFDDNKMEELWIAISWGKD